VTTHTDTVYTTRLGLESLLSRIVAYGDLSGIIAAAGFKCHPVGVLHNGSPLANVHRPHPRVAAGLAICRVGGCQCRE